MKQELELKHIHQYGKGLKGELTSHGAEMVISNAIVESIHYDEPCITFNNCEDHYFNGESLTEFKPYLYDLSFLTKEITHKGETFVPIVELLKIKFPKEEYRLHEIEYENTGHPTAWFKNYAPRYIVLRPYIDLCDWEHWIVQKLIEWKFAIDIPEGTWIDVNTLKDNPYEY